MKLGFASGKKLMKPFNYIKRCLKPTKTQHFNTSITAIKENGKENDKDKEKISGPSKVVVVHLTTESDVDSATNNDKKNLLDLGLETNTHDDHMSDFDKTLTQDQVNHVQTMVRDIISNMTVEPPQQFVEPENQIIKWSDTVPFTFPISGGQVIKVYDGDTITIASKLPYPESPLYRLSVRLNGIDTPEIKGSNDDEKQAAKNARDAVSNLIMQKHIRLENVQSEKYGRILADVYFKDLHLNKWLIDNRYAVEYDGGTKIAPKSWLRYKETGEK